MVAPRPFGPGLIAKRVRVAAEHVAMLRYLLEAHDGLGLMHSDGSGSIVLMAPESQAKALGEFVEDLLSAGLASRGEALDDDL